MYQHAFIFLFFVVATGLSLFHIYKMNKSNTKDSRKRSSLKLLFTLYLCGVASITIVPLRASRTQYLGHHFNFTPVVSSYDRYKTIRYYGDKDGYENFRNNIIGNIIMFIPLGLFLPWIYRKNFVQVTLIALLSSSLIEFTQFLNMYIGYYRYVDVDDVILNTTGGIVGYIMYLFLKNKWP